MKYVNAKISKRAMKSLPRSVFLLRNNFWTNVHLYFLLTVEHIYFELSVNYKLTHFKEIHMKFEITVFYFSILTSILILSDFVMLNTKKNCLI